MVNISHRKLNRYSDRTLKALASGKYIEPIYYGTGTERTENKIEGDFFAAIRIEVQYVQLLASHLERLGFINVIERGGTRSVDQVLHEETLNKKVQIKLTEKGSLFINSTSFFWEESKMFIQTWIPLTLSIVSIILTLALNYIEKTKIPRIESAESKIKVLEGRKDTTVYILYRDSIRSIPLKNPSKNALKDSDKTD